MRQWLPRVAYHRMEAAKGGLSHVGAKDHLCCPSMWAIFSRNRLWQLGQHGESMYVKMIQPSSSAQAEQCMHWWSFGIDQGLRASLVV